MLPNQRSVFPPYFIPQPFPFSYSPFLMPNYYPYIYGNIACQNAVSSMAGQTLNYPQAEVMHQNNGRSELEQVRLLNSSSPQNNRQQNNLPKQKAIKKPANRPATYLTERKFYLTQALPEEEEIGRCLRPRKTKKRHHHQKNQNNQLKDQEKLKFKASNKETRFDQKETLFNGSFHSNHEASDSHLNEKIREEEFFCQEEEKLGHKEVKLQAGLPIIPRKQ